MEINALPVSVENLLWTWMFCISRDAPCVVKVSFGHIDVHVWGSVQAVTWIDYSSGDGKRCEECQSLLSFDWHW